MSEALNNATEILLAAEFSVARAPVAEREAIVFENSVCLGFLLSYASTHLLLESWQKDSSELVSRFGLALRHSGEKAWNAYTVLVAEGERDDGSQAALADLEENLVGTRKVARDGVKTIADMRAVLLPLLPMQAAPKLPAVDIRSEIRQRAQGIDGKSLDAFFSSADESMVLQFLEEAP